MMMAPLFLLLTVPASAAAEGPILYRYQYHQLYLNPDVRPEWRATEEVWLLNGAEVQPPAALRVDGDVLPALPEGMVRTTRPAWNREAIRDAIRETIAGVLDREPGAVTISRSATGVVLFDGVGMLGRRVDIDAAADLTIAALEGGIAQVVLPVEEIQPAVTVSDPELVAQGIAQVVTVGESDFSGSPGPRRHNIAVGLSRFNGHVIPQDETFSFNEVLGPVDASTGYRKELVIKGDKTLPDYGGGLCQVSTTAYRGAWQQGFPIEERWNHSYVVRYYAPEGTDATIYPPNIDFRFRNDGPSALLLQTYIDPDDRAYFIYYGTPDARSADLLGPVVWGSSPPPPERVEYTTEIPAGTTRKVGSAVPGMKTLWYRAVTPAAATGAVMEPVQSSYEARPLFHQIGVAELPPEGGDAADVAPPEDPAEEDPVPPLPPPRSPRRRSS